MKIKKALKTSLIYLFPMHTFFTPWKRQKTLRFSDVFIGRERVHWEKNGLMGLICPNLLVLPGLEILLSLSLLHRFRKTKMTITTIILSTFLLPVHDIRNSILNWVLKVNHLFENVLKIYKQFFACICNKKPLK